MRSKKRLSLWLLMVLLGLATSACRSHGIDVTIQNNSSVPIRNVELDYPTAAFGTAVIAPGKSYWYHIKPSGSGEVSLSFEPENGKAFREKGPTVHAGDSGTLTLIVEQDAGQQWRMRVQAFTHP
jgi:hypothetical protein